MAVESVSLPRDNSLEELRVVIEEKKGEVKRKFAELKKLLEISENTATNRLDRIYTDVKEGVERNERTVTQLEQAKNALNSTLVDNDTTLFLQTTNQNIDDQIAKARNSACVVPKHISLRWSIEELKQSIENVCEVISSTTAETPVSTEQPNKIELEGVRKELEQRTKELVSLQKDKLQMQMYYQNEISNLKSSLEELNYNCSSLKAKLQKQSEYSKHTLTTESLTTRIEDLEMQLSLENSECEDLQRKVGSLQSDLKEAQDMLAAKLENPRESDISVMESVYHSLPPGFPRKDHTYKTTQSAEEDYVRIPKKQMEQYETNTQDLKSRISLLRNQLESKEIETSILKMNLDDSREELENTILQLQQTQQSNPTKVQSKRDSQTGTVVEEKQAQYTRSCCHKQQSKYATTRIFVNEKSSLFYALNQVDNPSELVGELVVCRSKWKSEYVIGTLKVVIPSKLRYEKAIVGIEFIDGFGDSSGSYAGVSYFKTIYNCAVFLSTAEVYISCNESPKFYYY